MSELTQLDGLDQGALVRTGEVTSEELVEAAATRIQEVDPAINAVIHRRLDRARDESRRGAARGPLAGVPTLLKDLGCTLAGEPNHCGNDLLRRLDHRADEDAVLTGAIRDGGLIILGRTNVPEFGLVNTTEPRAHGPSRNPWDLSRSTGGSSGGSAAAVATGMVPLAQASDGGGSIRMPASHCGVFGLKPSWSRISHVPDAEVMERHSTYGFISRSVRDSAAALDLAIGHHPGDAAIPGERTDRYIDVVVRDPARLRIGVMDVPDVNGFAVDPEINDIVRDAARLLEALGHVVEPSFPKAMIDPEYHERWLKLLSPSVTHQFHELQRLKGAPLEADDAEEMAWWWREQGAQISAADHVANQVWRDRFRHRMAAWWADGFDILLSPVLPVPPTPLGHFTGTAGIEESIRILCFTPQFNTSGFPAASVPLGVTTTGLPVGVQLGGAAGREDLLLQLSAQVERARPWGDRLPLAGQIG